MVDKGVTVEAEVSVLLLRVSVAVESVSLLPQELRDNAIAAKNRLPKKKRVIVEFLS